MRILDIQSVKDAREEIGKIGVDSAKVAFGKSKVAFGKSAYDHLLPKLFNTVIKIDGVSVGAANIIKQTALSCGTDAAVARGVITGEVKKSGVLLFGNYRQIENIALKITDQPFGLSRISREMLKLIKSQISNLKSQICLNLKKHKFDFTRTYICGVINVTPDSFSDGGIYLDKERAIDRAYQIVEEGADMIDIGGESTRPGADRVSVKEELKRVMPVIEGLSQNSRSTLNSQLCLSIDTYKSEVAKEALEAGCEIVNDISGLRFDNDMEDVIAEYDAGCIITHIKGKPRDMQKNPHYESVIDEIIDYLKEGIEIAEKSGIKSDRIMIDPGIGFGKRNPGDNLLIIKKLKEFKVFSKPIFIGISRKSFIDKVLHLPIEERVEGSLAASVIAILNGANILRTHDVKETVKAAKMADVITHGFY